ncbi:MAG: RimJ/RimL family protein N-acetyltransferase [Flavobacteriales bacterium]|jgi:RimJ/RimL family protein N-acetyltransferase
MNNKYIFQSERLGFRTWQDSDLADLWSINSDAEVMEFFPGITTSDDTWNFIQRMQLEYAKNGFCYYAVELLDTRDLIGFIGIARQDYEADFTPCVDIGWRLGRSFWGHGYASEAALACVSYAFDTLGILELVSVAPSINLASVRVMEKIGMSKVKEFSHPLLKDNPELQNCVLFKLENKNTMK